MSDPALALKLKDEGNALFVASKFDEACAKYAEAVKLDEDNAILYSNRAACYLNLKDYDAAKQDAAQATRIDPNFSKAWTRLATAHQGLDEWDKAVLCWKQAIAALPTSLSAAEKKQKTQCEAGLAQAKTVFEKKKSERAENVLRMAHVNGQLPWQLAEAMKGELIAAQKTDSSVWVIAHAYEEFMNGVRKMKSQKVFPGGKISGTTGALADLSNAILRDERVFHIEDKDFASMYDYQVRIEANAVRAWTDDEPDVVIEHAIRRHRQEGWVAVRKALDVTVRAWIMLGFILGGLTGHYGEPVTWLNKAIMLIEWGRSAAKNLDEDTRGAIFRDTFLRGVRKLHMSAILQAYGKEGRGLESSISLEDMYEEAEEVIRDVKAHPFKPGKIYHDVGFANSFIVYPMSQALSMKAFYHKEMAHLANNGDVNVKADHCTQASIFYKEAADILPEDDELHVWFLQSSLSAMFKGGAPLQVTMPIMKRIRLAYPQMLRIWANSAMSQGERDKIIQSTMWFEEDAQKGLDEGRFTLMSKVMPSTHQE